MSLVFLSAFVVLVHASTAEHPTACSQEDVLNGDCDNVHEVSLLQTRISLEKLESKKHHHAKDRQTTSTNSVHRKAGDAAEKPLVELTKNTIQNSVPEMDAAAPASIIKQNFSATAALIHAAHSPVRRLLAIAWADMHSAEQTHKILLVVICVLGLVSMMAVHYQAIHKASGKGAIVDCLTNNGLCTDQNSWHLALGPTAAFKAPAHYSFCPTECPHALGLRTYKQKLLSFQICDQCGSRWMFQKEMGKFTQIAPRALPADPE